MDIKMLYLQGHSIRKIADLTGLSRNTVRRVLREKGPRPFQTPERSSKLDPFKDYVAARFLARIVDSRWIPPKPSRARQLGRKTTSLTYPTLSLQQAN